MRHHCCLGHRGFLRLVGMLLCSTGLGLPWIQICSVSAFSTVEPKSSTTKLAIQSFATSESTYSAGNHNHHFTPQIVYESDRMLAINKPPGVSHHDDGETGELGIVSKIREYYNSNNTFASDTPNSRLFGVHRLDRMTSGILLFAKDGEMASILGKKFKDNDITKYYIGISNHKPKKQKQGLVKGDMVRGRRKSWYLTEKNKNNYAVTRFFTAGLGRLYEYKLTKNDQVDDSPSGYDPKTCLLFHPHTGKTHQIRVAAKSVGLPLMADPIYGGVSGLYSRGFLHASAIHIPLEDHGVDSITIWCPPPFAPLLWDSEVSEVFDEVVCSLFQKHCECPQILEAIMQSGYCKGTFDEA